MTLTPYFQFGNIKAVESANFPLSRGVTPSVCTISMLPGVQFDRVPKTMTFGDGLRLVLVVCPPARGCPAELAWPVAHRAGSYRLDAASSGPEADRAAV
jgi:hypothetical protein